MLLPTSRTFVSRDFPLELGARLPELVLAYESWGRLAPSGDNAVLLCHGFTSNPHAGGDGGWWSALIGPGKPLDTDRYFVVCANMLGSSYGSTGPASVDPATGRPYGRDFPEITVGDMVAAQRRLLDGLGIKRLAAVVGYSYGCYLTFHWAVTYPDAMRALVPVAGSIMGRGGPETVQAFRDRFAPCAEWNGGHYYDRGKAGCIFETLTALRIETLRNYGVGQVLSDKLDDPSEVDRQLKAMARQWAEEFDPNSLIAMRKAAIRFDARPKAASIKAPVLYVLVRTDSRVPRELGPETTGLLRRAGVDARFFEIDSEYGHRAPAEAWRQWGPVLTEFLNEHRG